MCLYSSDESERTKHHAVYDVFPNEAKKRKPSRQEVKIDLQIYMFCIALLKARPAVKHSTSRRNGS